MNFVRKGTFNLLALALIGLVSLGLMFSFNKTVKVTADGNTVETSKFALGVFDSSGSFIFSTSPLNDYYYEANSRGHLEDKLLESNTGNVLDQFLIKTRGIFLNTQSLTWKTMGSNSKGKSSVNYEIVEVNNGIRINRSVTINKIKPDHIGQVLRYCSGCIIHDDKNRAFFNGDTINSAKTALASKLKLTAFVLGENEFFLPGSKKIFIVGTDGTTKAEIDLKESEVFLQEKWNLLEFKAPTSGGNSVNQTINISV